MKFICGCGVENVNNNDWFCHFRWAGFWNGVKNLLFTSIKL